MGGVSASGEVGALFMTPLSAGTGVEAADRSILVFLFRFGPANVDGSQGLGVGGHAGSGDGISYCCDLAGLGAPAIGEGEDDAGVGGGEKLFVVGNAFPDEMDGPGTSREHVRQRIKVGRHVEGTANE